MHTTGAPDATTPALPQDRIPRRSGHHAREGPVVEFHSVGHMLPDRPDMRYWHEVRRVTAREDHRNMRYGSDVIPVGHRTYLKAKVGGDNSMFGKAGRTETVEVRAGRGPDGMVKPTPVEPQCPNCRQYRSDMTVDIRRPPEPGDCSCPHGKTSRAGRVEVQRPQGHERGTYNHPIVPRARNTGLPTGREP
jgi:hypothetical protein